MLFFTLFFAGILTILLPCVLPLVPIVLGVSIVDRNKWRPFMAVSGMVVSFVAFTFLLQVVLRQFVELADYIRIATFDMLFLFGLGFLFHHRVPQWIGAVLGGFFFWSKGWIVVALAMVSGVIVMEVGGTIVGKIQQFGTNVQQKAREGLGANTLATSFVVGLTMGLVWVPCAGPALGFALSLVRNEPGLRALLFLSAYGAGAGLPLLLIGYGGQSAIHSVRFLSRYSGRVKEVSGVLLIASAVGFQFNLFQDLQIWLVQHTRYGTLGTELERRALGGGSSLSHSSRSIVPSSLPKLSRAPEFSGLGPWHNSKPLTVKELRGKVVLVDFWTYSCINCIRTLPYIQGYWDAYREKPFVLIGVHTPEFVFEKDEHNVADAVRRHGLTYPVAQDNDYKTWDAFSNHYWPAKYLIDAEGYIRYTHFGEGGYEETERAIESLLAEIGVTVATPGGILRQAQGDTNGARDRTPETYLGSRSWPSLVNGSRIPSDGVVTYKRPANIPLHRYALVGDWQLVDQERQVLRSSDGEIRMKFLGGEINLVLGLEPGAKHVAGEVLIDGKHAKNLTIDRHDLFPLFKGAYGEHEMVLKLHGKGVEGYAFTFGS